MNPFEHGEVFVTDDGGETDLDLGHYERFIDEPCRAPPTPRPARSTRRCWPPSAGATTSASTVQVIPHITDEIKRRIRRLVVRRRRRGDHRGRRHRRRHRDPALPRGHPAVPQGGRPRQRVLRARHARAVHRAVGRAEDQADAALRHRAAQPRHPARRDRVPQRGADLARAQAQDLQPVRRPRARRGQRRRRPQHLRAAARAARRGPRRRGVPPPPARTASPTCRAGRRWSGASSRPTARCASASSASTST